MNRITLFIAALLVTIYCCSLPKSIEDLEIDALTSCETFDTTALNACFSYISQHPNVLTYEFRQLKKQMDIFTSDDKKVRVFTWRNETTNLPSYVVYDKSKVSLSSKIQPVISDFSITKLYQIGDINNTQYLMVGKHSASEKTDKVSAMIYELTTEGLTLCEDCFDESALLEMQITSTIADSLDFQYDEENNEIIYNEYEKALIGGHYAVTKNQRFWRFENHQFFPVE